MRGGDPAQTWADVEAEIVFPACAGVILYCITAQKRTRSFPRMRGGDPAVYTADIKPIQFSPHARG